MSENRIKKNVKEYYRFYYAEIKIPLMISVKLKVILRNKR